MSSVPVVSIARGWDIGETTARAIAACGGLGDIVFAGCSVFIKPNLVGPSPSGTGRVTNWLVVQEIVNECNSLGASRVLVGECPVEGDWKDAMAFAGYLNLTGCILMDPNAGPEGCRSVTAPRSLVGSPIYLPESYLKADVIISVPVLKTHFMTGVSLGMKNLGVGIPPLSVYSKGGCKGKLHDLGVNRVIVDVTAIRAPDLTVIDGTVGGEGKGPTEPTPVPLGIVIAGRDVVAVDSVGAAVMGLSPLSITHIAYAAGIGLGEADLDRISIVGEPIRDVVQEFRRPPNQGYPIRRSMVIWHAPAGFSIGGPPARWLSARWDVVEDQRKQPIARIAVMHDWSHLFMAWEPLVPVGRVDAFLSFGMPFEDGVEKGRHLRNPELDIMLSVSPPSESEDTNREPGALPPLPIVLCEGARPLEGASALWLGPSSGIIEAAVPLSSLRRRSLVPLEEVWLDLGVMPLVTSDTGDAGLGPGSLWSGAIHLGSYTDPASAGRGIVLGSPAMGTEPYSPKSTLREQAELRPQHGPPT